MIPLILTILGYLMIPAFLIFCSVYPVTLDTNAWYDSTAWMMLVLSFVLNILCFFISILYIIKKYKIWLSITALIFSIIYIIVVFSTVSIEKIVITEENIFTHQNYKYIDK